MTSSCRVKPRVIIAGASCGVGMINIHTIVSMLPANNGILHIAADVDQVVPDELSPSIVDFIGDQQADCSVEPEKQSWQEKHGRRSGVAKARRRARKSKR